MSDDYLYLLSLPLYSICTMACPTFCAQLMQHTSLKCTILPFSKCSLIRPLYSSPGSCRWDGA